MLSTFPSPTIDFEIPETVPVNVGEARLAFRSSAVCVAVETGLFASDVLSTLDRPTLDFDIVNHEGSEYDPVVYIPLVTVPAFPQISPVILPITLPSNVPNFNVSYAACVKLTVVVGSSITDLNNFHLLSEASRTRPEC
jgi:hypothetical protein